MLEVLDKYDHQFKHINKSTIAPIFDEIKVWDVDDDPDFTHSSQVVPKRTIAVGSNISNETALKLNFEHNVWHVVQADRSDFFSELLASSMMLKTPEKFMKNPLPFFLKTVAKDSLESLLKRKAQFKFTSTVDKAKIMAQVEKYLAEDSKAAPFQSTVLTIVNEMILNALFNAPVDQAGEYIYRDLDRANYVSYPEGKEGVVYLANDNTRLFIACEDPFGSISFQKLMNRLHEIYVSKSSSPFGLGVKMIIDNSSGIYFVKKNAEKTQICCSFPLGMGLKAALKVPKSFHFCII